MTRIVERAASASNERVLAIIAAHVPSKKTCSQLARTIWSVWQYHPRAFVLVVDNESPVGNVNNTLNLFLEGGYREQLHLTERQQPSRGQLGSWLVAHQLLRNDSIPAVRSIHRVLVLQHSTPLTSAVPARHRGCQANSLSGHRSSSFVVNQREYRRDGPNAIFSAIAANLSIRCRTPCLDPQQNWEPIVEKSAAEWTMIPHAVLDFSRPAFLALGDALTHRHAVRTHLDSLWSAVDRRSFALKEVNGQLERFSGVMMAWLNGFERRCEWPVNHSRTATFVNKVHGKTFGGSWRAADGIRKPREEVCPPRHPDLAANSTLLASDESEHDEDGEKNETSH